MTSTVMDCNVDCRDGDGRDGDVGDDGGSVVVAMGAPAIKRCGYRPPRSAYNVGSIFRCTRDRDVRVDGSRLLCAPVGPGR